MPSKVLVRCLLASTPTGRIYEFGGIYLSMSVRQENRADWFQYVARKSNREDNSSSICPGEIARILAAASFIARGIPSSRSQIDDIAFELRGVTLTVEG